MAIIGQSAGLLFKIDGDASQLHREMRGVEAAFGRLGSNFGSVAGIATVATAAVTAVAAAAVTGAVALFNFTKQAAEYGSTLYDASIQTGLSAEAISALKIAADSSGSSLESIAGSVAKFNVLLGQAAQGNEKAEATLKRYGITAKDTDGALNQAIATIARMETQDQKAAAAKDLFKDRTAAILPVINQVDGKFDEFIETAKKLGVVLSKEDLKAADDFGDTLEVLGTQAKIAGVKFASELMPMVTGAMQSISASMAANQDAVRAWGNEVVYTVRGIQTVFNGLASVTGSVLSGLTLGLINNQNQFTFWATAVRAAVWSVTGGISELIRMLPAIGRLATTTGEGQGVWLGPLAPPKQPSVGGAAKGGGGRGGGGTSAADKAEQERKKEIQEAEKVIQRKLELFRNASAEQIAILDEQLSRQEINEMEHLEKVRKLKENEARYEALLLQQFSRNAKLNADERAEAEHKATIAATKARIETLETQIAINKQLGESEKERAELEKRLRKEVADFAKATSDEIHDRVVKNAEDEIDAAVEVYEQTIKSRRISAKERAKIDADLSQILARNAGVLRYENKAAFENAVIELDRWKREKEEEVKAHIKDEEERKAALEAVNAEYERRLKLLKDIHDQEEQNIQKREAVPVVPTVNTSSLFGLKGPMEELKQLAKDTFGAFAQGMGQMLTDWILLGSAGPNAMRKMTASILAGLAAQAAMKSLYYLAEGFAALANPFTAWMAPGYFKAAAIMAIVAGAAAIGGRALAGDLFKQQANTATGGGSSGQRSGGGGGAYSSQPDQTITTGINSPGGGSGGRSSGGLGTLVIRDKSGMFDQLFEMAWERNGRMRRRMQAEFGK